MKTDIKQQAKGLFFQTGLSKTQIATVLSISRTTLHYWIREGEWDRLKQASQHMPAILAEKCYYLFNQLIDAYLSERRATNPISFKDADTLHRLTITIQKLKGRVAVNECVEMFGHFQDKLKKTNPGLAIELFPYVDEFLASKASAYPADFAPEAFLPSGRLPFDPVVDHEEERLDQNDCFEWEMARMNDQTTDTPGIEDNKNNPEHETLIPPETPPTPSPDASLSPTPQEMLPTSEFEDEEAYDWENHFK